MALTSQGTLVGAELGTRFANVRLLHAGSRFSIYEGLDEATQRAVAIKVVDGPGSAWLYDTLEREAEILAKIGAHPNVVTVYQRINLEDGRPAILLERCNDSLADSLLGGGRLSLQETAATGIKLAGALETTHRAGYLHCDVQPRNILVTEWGEAVLAGFDEVVSVDGDGEATLLHNPTPHTAPELLQGDPPSPATDVYGLASTLYELAAGRAAFRAYAGESPATVIVRVLSGTVAPILAPDVPLELSDLLTWAMSADPRKRPPTPAWLAEELARLERRLGWPHTRMIAG